VDELVEAGLTRFNFSINALDDKIASKIAGMPYSTEKAKDICRYIASKANLTRWRMHYITFEILYNSKEAGNNWVLDPSFFMTYDYQFSGNGSCKTHQFTVGVQAKF